jgi:antitoxin ParD1/3/4
MRYELVRVDASRASRVASYNWLAFVCVLFLKSGEFPVRSSVTGRVSRLPNLFANVPAEAERGTDMNVSIGERWETFVDRIVREGRYGSASEVVREGLRLVEEREAKLKALRRMLEASLAAGGEASEADLDAALAAKAAQLTKESF